MNLWKTAGRSLGGDHIGIWDDDLCLEKLVCIPEAADEITSRTEELIRLRLSFSKCSHEVPEKEIPWTRIRVG